MTAETITMLLMKIGVTISMLGLVIGIITGVL